MKSARLVLVIVGIMIIGCGAGYAEPAIDNDNQNSIVTLAVPDAGLLDICTQANATKTLGLDQDAAIDFEAGYTDMEPGYPTLTIKSNKGWRVLAKSSGFGAVEGYNKDAGDLMLVNTGTHKSNGFDAFKSLSLEDQEVASYGKGIKGDENAMQYRIKLDSAKDIPGTYIATVTYTLVTGAR